MEFGWKLDWQTILEVCSFLTFEDLWNESWEPKYEELNFSEKKRQVVSLLKKLIETLKLN